MPACIAGKIPRYFVLVDGDLNICWMKRGEAAVTRS